MVEVREEFQAKPGRMGEPWRISAAGLRTERGNARATSGMVSVAACGIFAVASGLLSSCGEQAPECRGSVVVPLGPSCPMA